MKNTSIKRQKRNSVKKIFRVVGLVLIALIIFIAIISSMVVKPSNSDKIWDTQMTLGNPDAKNYFVVYSDLVCPYCIAFENAIIEHEEDFKKYIEENDILFEVRLSDFLYEYGETSPIHSRYSALGAYCAKTEGKFWDYYNLAVTSVWNDYFKTSSKAAFTKMANLGKDYWINIGKEVGLSENFENCVRNEDPLEEIIENANKTLKLASGMPYFKFNNYTNSGFDLSWDYQYVLMYFQAGLESRK